MNNFDEQLDQKIYEFNCLMAEYRKQRYWYKEYRLDYRLNNMHTILRDLKSLVIDLQLILPE